MKFLKSIMLLFTLTLLMQKSFSQNVLMNILTQQSGVVKKGQTVLVEISICNTDAIDSVLAFKLKPQISFPSSISTISKTGHTLPPGWTIISNDGSTIKLSNGQDIIPAHACRTILISMEGTSTGGPSTISGSLLFSNGVAPGSSPGGPTKNDNAADNNSTSTCKVIR